MKIGIVVSYFRVPVIYRKVNQKPQFNERDKILAIYAEGKSQTQIVSMISLNKSSVFKELRLYTTTCL
jgi:hypothetical protein|tara:strand:+ start:347 stop:550 length:204 start_codon:yes stop_codon:yes gene_type:complete